MTVRARKNSVFLAGPHTLLTRILPPSNGFPEIFVPTAQESNDKRVSHIGTYASAHDPPDESLFNLSHFFNLYQQFDRNRGPQQREFGCPGRSQILYAIPKPGSRQISRSAASAFSSSWSMIFSMTARCLSSMVLSTLACFFMKRSIAFFLIS